MKKIFFFIAFTIIYATSQIYGQTLPVNIDSAYAHLKEQFDQYHKVSYIYNDDNCGGNIFIPSVWEGDIYNSISIDQADTNSPESGRSCTKIVLHPIDTAFSAIRYVYPENNIGQDSGYDLSESDTVKFYTKGSGSVEFLLGGTNRRPFYDTLLPYQDGIDLRSSGLINLTNTWTQHYIDLTDTSFWVYKDSTAGANNRYPKYGFMSDTTVPQFTFMYGDSVGPDNTCMKVNWFGNSQNWGGVYFFPPSFPDNANWCDPVQSYNLTGITKVSFQARSDTAGFVKFLFGLNCEPYNTEIIDSLTTEWQYYSLEIPQQVNCKNVVGGFGFSFGGTLNTPTGANIFIDNVKYEGVSLANDFSNTICGFKVSAEKVNNTVGATIYLDNVRYNKNRISQPRFCQSFISGSETLDITMKNRADVYDNALLLISNLMLYDNCQNTDTTYLHAARLIGDAFVYAMNHDRHFTDKRLRNSYMCGDIKHWDSIHSARLPGWWDNDSLVWSEDESAISTSTGNVAWAGLALTSLYEVTLDLVYLNAAKALAQWCIDSVYTSFGFKGGFEGKDNSQQKIKWKSTEHNLDLYALFIRLNTIDPDVSYFEAAENAKNFVLSMWDANSNTHFWTGTDTTGININYSPVPLDIQSWYLLAFRDDSTVYSNGIDWANDNCYLANINSVNYSKPLTGYKFSNLGNGIWFEGSAQASLANMMKYNNPVYSDSILSNIEYVQSHHQYPKFFNINNKGIVAAANDYTSTGYSWDYHNRLHIGATCWYLLAKLGRNPYYYPGSVITGTTENNHPQFFLMTYPNPFCSVTTIKYAVPVKNKVTVSIYDIFGKEINKVINEVKETGIYETNFDASLLNPGVYFCRLRIGDNFITEKLIVSK